MSIKIKIRLFVALMKYLPAGSKKNSFDLIVEESAYPLEIIRLLKIPFKPPLLVLVDGVQLSEVELKSRALKNGETMAVIPPLSGG